MDLDARIDPSATGTRLLVADWTLEPQGIVATCCAQSDGALRLLVPAWLHGLDWAGDPRASVPCAERQRDRLAELCGAAGLHVASAEVGDPDPLTAIGDALAAGPADEILLFARGWRAARHPLGLATRAERLSGVPVQCFSTPRFARPQRRIVLGGAHCAPGRPAHVA